MSLYDQLEMTGSCCTPTVIPAANLSSRCFGTRGTDAYAIGCGIEAQTRRRQAGLLRPRGVVGPGVQSIGRYWVAAIKSELDATNLAESGGGNGSSGSASRDTLEA